MKNNQNIHTFYLNVTKLNQSFIENIELRKTDNSNLHLRYEGNKLNGINVYSRDYCLTIRPYATEYNNKEENILFFVVYYGHINDRLLPEGDYSHEKLEESKLFFRNNSFCNEENILFSTKQIVNNYLNRLINFAYNSSS